MDYLIDIDIDAAHEEALWAAEFVSMVDGLGPSVIAEDLAVMQEIVAIETLRGIVWGDSGRPPLRGIDVLRAFAFIDAGLPPELYDFDLVA